MRNWKLFGFAIVRPWGNRPTVGRRRVSIHTQPCNHGVKQAINSYLNREWWCIRSSTGRRCSNYIWVIHGRIISASSPVRFFLPYWTKTGTSSDIYWTKTGTSSDMWAGKLDSLEPTNGYNSFEDSMIIGSRNGLRVINANSLPDQKEV